ncbi:MAG: hypothetical protein HYV06_04390 [Deltaproteobacteria bacterium]|nr:hypothetical protein [Deltaproteobacteria bacterium]
MGNSKGKTESPELQKLLAYQDEVRAAVKNIAAIEALIEIQQTIVNEANGFESGLPALHVRREDLLAELVTGVANKKELDTLDKEIMVEKERLDDFASRAARTVPDAKQAISGLRRKLEAAVAGFDTLKDKKPTVIADFIHAEAERLGTEYAELTSCLLGKYRELGAYGRLLWEVGYTSVEVLPGGLSIPLFKGLASHRGLAYSHAPSQIMEVLKANVDPDYFREAAKEAKARISALGVEW